MVTCCLQSYGMKRLVRGLGSSRQGARQGFALALTLVLGKAGERGCISAQDTATVITSVLEAAGSAKVRRLLFGVVGDLVCWKLKAQLGRMWPPILLCSALLS